MKLDTKKVLNEIDEHKQRIEKATIKDQEFEVEHGEVLNLCRIIFDRKADYKEINIEYPNKIIINLKMYSGEPNQEIPDKKTRSANRQELATKILEILQKAKKFYSLKAKLEK